MSRQDVRPILGLILGLLVSYLYTGLVTNVFAVTLPHPLFLPQAVILSVLLLTPTRRWWLYLLVYYAMQVAQGVYEGLELPYVLASNLANIAEPLVGALLVHHFVARRDQIFEQLRDIGIYVACVAAGSIVGASWGAMTRLVMRDFDYWQSWQGWFLGDLLASLVVTPVIVIWASLGLDPIRRASRPRLVEAGLLGLSLIGVGWLVFSSRLDSSEAAPALLYLPVPLLVWAAVRFGPPGLITSLAIVLTMAIAGAANDLGPFQDRTPAANVFTLQLFLLGVGVPLLLLSALVSERQKTQVRLAHSAERYRAMVRSLPHAAVLLFGPDLRHSFADGQGLADIGLTKEAVEGHTLSEAFPTALIEALEPHYMSALAGTTTSFELMQRESQFLVYAMPLSDATTPTGMLVIHDVTDQKRAEVLAELDRARTAFFSNVSHELRTPLTLILGPLQDALERGALSGESLQMVNRNALRLQRLVNGLLDFSRIEAGRMHVDRELTDVAALTGDLVSNFRPMIERAGLRFIVEAPPLPDDVAVYVDRDMWDKIVLNLVSNAFNHTFEGEVRVSVRLSSDRGAVELEVHDTGIGIPAAEQARIFERFHQVEGARSRTQEGSGIGLALVQELVRLQDGTITVESVEGLGTTFTVRLPVGAPALPALTAAPTSKRPPISEVYLNGHVAEDGVAAASSDDPDRVLVVDDNPDMRRYLRGVLAEHWTVQTVADGATALQVASATPPALVILDVMMPGGLNGFEVLAALRAHAATQRVPVIMLSARAGEEASVEGLVAGASDYVVKPFAAAELTARVRTQIDAAHARSEAEAAVKARDEFVAVVVHDLRHPLAAVKWHVQILRRRARRTEPLTSEDLSTFLATIELGINTLSGQIDELHDAMRLQAGRPLDLQTRSTDLVALVQSVMRQYEGVSERYRFVCETREPSLMGVWDPRRLERVIDNLLSNAMKFTPAGGDVILCISRDGEWAVLSVADPGVGIPAADLPHVFERYWRGSNVTGRIAGSGLGLSGARGIIEQHGGTISVASAEGQGSTFTLRLPLEEVTSHESQSRSHESRVTSRDSLVNS
jgi:signal transduction histidine kinase/integral membrane sensor domain MASE1